MRQGIRGFLLTLKDPEAVDLCVSAGVGASLSLDVGGKTDSLHGVPVRLTGVVRGLSDGSWEDNSPTHGGGRCEIRSILMKTLSVEHDCLLEAKTLNSTRWNRFFGAGDCAHFEAETGQTVLLTQKQSGNTSRGQFYQIGIEPERFRVVVAKGVQSPRPAYQPIASHLLMANTVRTQATPPQLLKRLPGSSPTFCCWLCFQPGITSADMTSFHFEKRRVPLYPFEKDAAFRPRM